MQQIGSDPIAALQALWESRRGRRSFPSRADFPVEILKPWLGRLQLVEIVRNGNDRPRYRFRLVGVEINRLDGEDVTGKFVDEVFKGDLEWVIRDYDGMLLSQRPERSTFRRPAPNSPQHTQIMMEVNRLMLPLAGDGETVDMLMVYMKVEDVRFSAFRARNPASA